ncbi:MAG: hypothetical protein ACHQAX_06595 [Gammaproteobacteria bacterium]
MENKSLLNTNPYLKNPATRQKLIEQSVITSCGVEGIRVDFSKIAHISIPKINKDTKDN